MLKRFVILAVFGAFLFGRPCMAENEHGKPDAKHAEAGESQGPAPPTHVIIDPSSAPIHVETKSADGKQEPEEKPLPRFLRPEWIIVYITAVYVAITLWMLIAIKQQAGHMKRQTGILADSVAVAQKAAKAAETSATAAMGVAVPTLMLEEFAFVPRAGDCSMEENLRLPCVMIAVKNYGQTPAIMKAFAVEFICGELPQTLDYPRTLYFDVGTAIETGKVIDLEKNGVRPWEEFSAQDAIFMANGSKSLIVCGCVWYDDVFGSPTRTLEFCKMGGGFRRDEGSVFWVDWPSPYAQRQHPNEGNS